MKNDFSKRFEIVYKRYSDQTGQMGTRPNETAFGRYLVVSKTTVQRWKGGQVPAAKDIKTLHDKLGFAYDWLIAGEGEMYDTTARKLAEQQAEIDRLRRQATNEPTLGKAAGQE